MGERDIFALLVFVGVCAWFWGSLAKLFALAIEDEHVSHVLLIPALTTYLLLMNRRAILASHVWSPAVGVLFMAGGMVFPWLMNEQEGAQDRLAAEILGFVMTCWGLFLLSFGEKCFRKNWFALMVLLFMVPLPKTLLDAIIGFLQSASADMVDFIFRMLQIQVIRDGFIFTLSNFTIFVAEECSGIRSFLALVITSLVAGYWFLTSTWTRTMLMALVVPLAIVKNAFRIVGLTLLANYVDARFITDSALHRSGGIPLFVLSLAGLILVVCLLRKFEQRFRNDSSAGLRAQT